MNTEMLIRMPQCSTRDVGIMHFLKITMKAIGGRSLVVRILVCVSLMSLLCYKAHCWDTDMI